MWLIMQEVSLTVWKIYKKITGSEVFINPLFECVQEMAYELAAFSIEYLDAEGMYMAPGERSDVFMAVMSPRALWVEHMKNIDKVKWIRSTV